MSSDVTTISREIVEDFVLAPNSAYDKINNETITVLENCPVAKSSQSINYQLGGGSTATFSLKTNETSFIDPAFELRVRVPIKISVPANTALAGTSAYAACDYFQSMAVKEFGLLNAIDYLQLKLNGNVVTSTNEVYKNFKICSQYYDADMMLKKIPYSMPDVYSDFSDYNTALASHFISSVGLGGGETRFKGSAFYPLNIFQTTVSNEYNSRHAYIELDNADTVVADQTEFTGTVVLTSYIPFSVFSLPSDETLALYGVNDLLLQFNLRQDWVKHVFCINDTTIDDISFDNANSAKCSVDLMLSETSAPSYIQESIIDPTTGSVLPYRFNYSEIQREPVQTSNIAPRQIGEINSNQISVGSLPSRIYVSAIGLGGASATALTTPNYYGRIEQLDITIGNSTTTITGAERLYSMSLSNGLNRLRDAALYTSGYAICLDLNKDLGVGRNAIIGANTPTTIQIRMKVRNLTAVSQQFEGNFLLSFNSQLIYSDRNFSVSRTLILSSVEHNVDKITRELYDKHKFTRNAVIIGGSFWGTIFKGLKNAGRYVINNPDKVINFAKNAARVLTGSGPGRGNNIIGGAVATSSDRPPARTLMMGGGTANKSIFK